MGEFVGSIASIRLDASECQMVPRADRVLYSTTLVVFEPQATEQLHSETTSEVPIFHISLVKGIKILVYTSRSIR